MEHRSCQMGSSSLIGGSTYCSMVTPQLELEPTDWPTGPGEPPRRIENEHSLQKIQHYFLGISP